MPEEPFISVKNSRTISGFDILEIVSTGIIAIEKGASTIDEQTKEKEEFDYAKNVLSL